MGQDQKSPAPFLAGRPLDHAAEGPVDALDDPAGEGSRPAAGVEGGQNPVPDAARLVEGDDGVEVTSQPVLRTRQHDQQVGLVGVEAGLLVQGRVLEAVLPAVAALLLPALHPVHGGYPVAGVGVADGVVEGLDLPVENGAGDELAAALALHELPAGVDQDDAAAERLLGQGYAAGWDRYKRRQEQRCGQENQPPGPTRGLPNRRWDSHVVASSSRVGRLPAVESEETRGETSWPARGASTRGPPRGLALKRAGFDVIPVYRDWRQFWGAGHPRPTTGRTRSPSSRGSGRTSR